MGIHKILPFVFATITFGSTLAQEESDPVASIITSDSEATGVLGGGWPPQNFGKSVGGKTVKEILNGTGEKVLKISDAAVKPAQALAPKPFAGEIVESKPVQQKNIESNAPGPKRVETKQVSPEPVAKKADPLLLAESSEENGEDPAISAPPVPTPIGPRVPVKSGTTENAEGPGQASPVLPAIGSGQPPLVLPPLPEVVDVLTPALKAPVHREPAPERAGVRSLYTLGPGDTVSFSTFDRSDLARTVRIAPDGTVSYLQAVAVNANGLTVDELRDRMEGELQKYRRDFRLIVSPLELRSKEFAILGRVRSPGTFPLDRPTTVLEGIALAQGVEIGTIRGSAYGLADFGRSFVARNGKKLDVDFAKLYHEGDLSQNVPLQPNDYLYVASVLKNEFFILGAVNNPGRVKMPDRITVAKAIALSGGFQKEAYRSNVLVIRGDINNPNVEVVNVRDVLRGNALDIAVESGDIIFVAQRPFSMVERAVDLAITTYVQTVTAEAINLNYTPVFAN